ncbi:MAG TPA: Zn-ribbon domain-containing OB-fold protein [Blastocatellia bacterium]|nr:Zn-ribbon domain-containing OB-fold protein [Blastocatellia bacterium]
MTEYVGPLPKPDNDSAEYWDAARRHKLVLQQCIECQRFRFYPRSVCPHCLSDRFEWRPASGRGKVYSFTVIHRAPAQAFRDRVPYVLALVELEEGVRMMTNIVECDPDTVRIGESVEVTFDDVTDEVTLPKFRLATTDQA